jgi:hypothetical protein
MKGFDEAIETISIRDQLDHAETIYEWHYKHCKFRSRSKCKDCEEHAVEIWRLTNAVENHEKTSALFASRGITSQSSATGPAWAKEWSGQNNWWSKE